MPSPVTSSSSCPFAPRQHGQCGISDVVVIGAGLAGASAACVLARLGLRVTLVDPRPNCPPVFKAEKIEPDQAELFRKLRIFQTILPHAAPIREVRSYYNGRLCRVNSTEQYGLFYSDMVNALRTEAAERATVKVGRVLGLETTHDLQRIKIAGADDLNARLVILACGINADIPSRLGLKRTLIQREHSLVLGFALAPWTGSAFPFDAATYYSTTASTGIDYISLFRFHRTMRANVVAFPTGSHRSWISRFLADPESALRACFPKLHRAIGYYRVASKVELATISLYRTEIKAPVGIVLIGDAAQNVCPSSGMGLTKILTDLDVLSQCIPQWFATPGMAAEKLADFYLDPRKVAADARALEAGLYRRQACTNTSLRWRIHRTRLHLAMQFGRPVLPPQDPPELTPIPSESERPAPEAA